MASLKSNAAILVVSTLFGILTQLIQFVFLGRYLASEQVGVASIVMVVVMFAQMFTDFGLSGYYVHRQQTTESEKSTLYWLNIILGSLIAVVVACTSPVISWFYSKDELIQLLVIVALSFPIIAAGSQLQASLLKSFSYKKLAFIEIVSRTIALMSFITAIYLKWGAGCVVASHMTLCIVKTSLLYLLAEKSEYPKFTFDKKYVSGGLRFGSYLILGQFLNQITLNLDKILIGKFLGMSSLGVYTLAKDLAMRSMQVVNPVVNKLFLPRYAALQQDKPALAKEVSKTLLLIGFFSSLIFFSLSILSPGVVEILYGSGKENVADILGVLAFYVLFRSFGNVSGTLLNSVGKTNLDFKWNLIASFIAVPAIFIFVQYDIETMSIYMALMQAGLIVLSYFILIKPILPFSFFLYIRHVFLFPVIGGLIWVIVPEIEHQGSLLYLVLNLLQWLVIYLIVGGLLYKTKLKPYL